jgi:hypothetical protein
MIVCTQAIACPDHGYAYPSYTDADLTGHAMTEVIRINTASVSRYDRHQDIEDCLKNCAIASPVSLKSHARPSSLTHLFNDCRQLAAAGNNSISWCRAHSVQHSLFRGSLYRTLSSMVNTSGAQQTWPDLQHRFTAANHDLLETTKSALIPQDANCSLGGRVPRIEKRNHGSSNFPSQKVSATKNEKKPLQTVLFFPTAGLPVSWLAPSTLVRPALVEKMDINSSNHFRHDGRHALTLESRIQTGQLTQWDGQ